MNKYHIIISIERARGTQCFEVEAISPEDALKKFKAGGGSIVAEEIEVESLHQPSVDDVVLVE